MMTAGSTLFVFDSTTTGTGIGKIIRGSRVILCPLTSQQDLIISLREDIGSAGVESDVVNFPERFNGTAFSVKKDYLEFIAEFPEIEGGGGKDLKEYFKMPGGDFSLWWFSLIAEKNTLKTATFHKLVQFLTLKRIAEEFSAHEIILDLEDRALTRTIKEFTEKTCIGFKDLRGHSTLPEFMVLISNLARTLKYSSYYCLKLFIIKVIMMGVGSRKRKFAGSRYLMVNYFPFPDPGSLKEGRFEDKYYQPFQRALEKRYQGKYAWLSIIASTRQEGLVGTIRLGKRINGWDQALYFLEEWIGFRDLLGISRAYLRTALKFLVYAPRLFRDFVYPEGDTRLWPIYKEEWYSSFCGWTLVEGLAFYHAFRKSLASLKTGTVVLYPAEMHAWEKALNVAARELGIRTVGVQHTIAPVMLLNYSNHPKELEEGDYVSRMPRPDLLACVGDITRKLFLASGWNGDRVFTWGAIRFQGYLEAMERKISWDEREDYVVVALSYSNRESKEVIRYVHEAYKDNPGYKVIIKGHPVHPVVPIVDSMGITLKEDVFQIVETPLGKLMPKAKAMIVTESSSALESLANQCPVIVPRLANTIDMNPLSGVSDIQVYVNSPEELRAATDDLMARDEAPIPYKDYEQVITQYCRFPASDLEYLDIMEEKLKKQSLLSFY